MVGVKRLFLICCATLPLLGGCATNQQTGTLVGGVGGAAVGAGVGAAVGRSPGAALLGAAIGGALGAVAGNLIGQQLDERDRQRQEAAVQQALMAPVYVAPQQTAPVRPPPRPVRWSSDHNRGTAGTATVTAVQREPSGGECRNVHEVAVISGKEVNQDTKYCRDSSGSWRAA